MIDLKKFSRCEFNSNTETLAFTQSIKPTQVHPVGVAVDSRYKSIKIIYIPDESREIDHKWLEEKIPKFSEQLLEICQKGFEHYESEGHEKDVRKAFIETIQDSDVFSTEAPTLFDKYGYPAFFELGQIAFVRKEDAIIFGGSFEDFFHYSEHGVDIALISDSVEFGENCSYDYLFESSPYE